MARDRLPAGFAIALTALHSLSLLACVVAIIASAISAAQTPKEAVTTIGAFVAGFWTTGVDIAEIVGLADRQRNRRRCPAKWLWLLELVTAIFCFALPAASTLGYEEVRYQRCRYVKYEDREAMDCGRDSGPMPAASLASMAGIYLAATIHTVLFFMTVIQLCVIKKRARSPGGVETVAQTEK
ncbi:hypothetical protein OQA88_10275 [Cercophora sp. LCS_1]